MESSQKISNSLSNPGFSNLNKVHIVGIGGTLMGNFASYLKRHNINVTGSDSSLYSPMKEVLENAQIPVILGYDAKNLTADGKAPDLVIIGNVIQKTNPEAIKSLECYPTTSLPKALEDLVLGQTFNIIVAGTHGKTTTSSLMAFVLKSAGKQPSYFIGGVPKDLPHSFHIESPTLLDSLFVLEGDEYDTAFWDKVPKFDHYNPSDVLLTSIEYDHADIYPDFESVERVFAKLCKNTKKHLIACSDAESVLKAARFTSASLKTYGIKTKTKPDFLVKNINTSHTLTQFELESSDQKTHSLGIQLPGIHNVLNATAVWIESLSLGIDPDIIKKALLEFQGVKRRQDIRFETPQCILIDDFAHHPTAVRETLKALKNRYPDYYLICAFEPRSATSRRRIFQSQYIDAFELADCLFIARPYDQSRIPQSNQFSSEELLSDIRRRHPQKTLELIEEPTSTCNAILSCLKQKNLIVLCSNGGFMDLPDLLTQALKVNFNI